MAAVTLEPHDKAPLTFPQFPSQDLIVKIGSVTGGSITSARTQHVDGVVANAEHLPLACHVLALVTQPLVTPPILKLRNWYPGRHHLLVLGAVCCVGV